MKKLHYFCLLSLCTWFGNATAADLITVYQQALTNDAVFQQAIAQRLSTKEGVPISIGAILPNISFLATPEVTRTGFSGTSYVATFNSASIAPRNNTQRTYNMSLTIQQTVFNYTQFATIASSRALSKGADATLNAALQDLMLRVANAYFAILRDEDNLSYSLASQRAYNEQYDNTNQQYKVGLKTITEVYTAQASYDLANANVIAARTQLANDKENLRVITNKYYGRLYTLSHDFPLVKPQPERMQDWVETAMQQNWSIKAAAATTSSAKSIVHAQFGGHLPTVTLQAILNREYTLNINGYNSLEPRNGPGTQTNRSVLVNVAVPIFSGGTVNAEVNQAIYNYQVSQQQLEQTMRNTTNAARQSYMNVVAGISQVMADRAAVKSNFSSLRGMQESYKVGTETLVDVLNQQQKLYQAQTQYAADRYAYIINLLSLKQAAGTLSFDDLKIINHWLYQVKKHKHQA